MGKKTEERLLEVKIPMELLARVNMRRGGGRTSPGWLLFFAQEINPHKPYLIEYVIIDDCFYVFQKPEDSFLKYRKFDFLGWLPGWKQSRNIINRTFDL